jgi:hypothetical protein
MDSTIHGVSDDPKTPLRSLILNRASGGSGKAPLRLRPLAPGVPSNSEIINVNDGPTMRGFSL